MAAVFVWPCVMRVFPNPRLRDLNERDRIYNRIPAP